MAALASISDRTPTGIGDTQTLNCERPAVPSERLGHDRCQPGERKHCQRLMRDAVTEHQHFLGGAARTAREQLERLSPFRLRARILQWARL
jgi:hypothetical protein